MNKMLHESDVLDALGAKLRDRCGTLAGLNLAQLEALKSILEPFVIRAGAAGTSKTTFPTRRVAYMIDEGKRARGRFWSRRSRARRPAR